jgi:hypothetical protein
LAQVLDIQKLNVDVQIMRSIASEAALAKLPDPKGHTAKSFITAIKTLYYSTSVPDSQHRYNKYLVLPSSQFLNLLMLNWKDSANVSGYDIDSQVESSIVTNTMFLNECAEMFCFLSAVYGYNVETSPFSIVTKSFITPLRELVGEKPLLVVSDLVHKVLRHLHVVTVLTVPLQTHIEAWAVLHGIPSLEAPIVTYYMTQLNNGQMAYMTSVIRALSLPVAPSNPTPIKKDAKLTGKGKPKNTHATVQPPGPKQYGLCTGWCLSIFYSNTCKKLSKTGECTYRDRTSGKTIHLKHTEEFDKLPISQKVAIQTHFDNHVADTLTVHQVNAFSS